MWLHFIIYLIYHFNGVQVRVHPSHELAGDSSPFHFNTIVDYTWETQYSHGRLIATHISSLFIAYVVKGEWIWGIVNTTFWNINCNIF